MKLIKNTRTYRLKCGKLLHTSPPKQLTIINKHKLIYQ